MDLRKIFRGGKARLLQGLLAGIVGALVASVFFFSGWLTNWEAKTWDWRVNLLAKPSSHTDKIRMILLDQPSLDWGKNENSLSWPWPRETYAKVTDFCRRTGVKALAFDVLYTEPSKDGVSDDQTLGNAMRVFPVVGAVFLSRTAGSESAWPAFAPVPFLKIEGIGEWIKKTGYEPFAHATFPIPEIAMPARVLANVQLKPDFDSVYRRMSFFEVFDGKVIPSLGLANYLAAKPDAKLSIEPGKLILNGIAIPIDEKGQVILNFRGPPGTHKRYSAADVIASEVNLQGGEKPIIQNIDDFKEDRKSVV